WALGLAHGPKPAVRRGQELDPLSSREAAKRGAVLAQDLPVDEVPRRLASEDGAAVRCGEEASAVDEDAARGREGPGVVSGRRPVPAQGIDAGRAAGSLVVLNDGGRRQEGVSPEVLIRHRDVDQVVSVGANEALSPVVEGQAELTKAGDRLVA